MELLEGVGAELQHLLPVRIAGPAVGVDRRGTRFFDLAMNRLVKVLARRARFRGPGLMIRSRSMIRSCVDPGGVGRCHPQLRPVKVRGPEVSQRLYPGRPPDRLWPPAPRIRPAPTSIQSLRRPRRTSSCGVVPRRGIESRQHDGANHSRVQSQTRGRPEQVDERARGDDVEELNLVPPDPEIAFRSQHFQDRRHPVFGVSKVVERLAAD